MKRRHGLRGLPFDLSLRDALGERLRVLPPDCAPYAIAGTVPKAVAQPRDEEEAALALAAASAEGAVVAIRGAGTKCARPPSPRLIDVVLDVTALRGVVEHAAADLTVTVRGGTTLASLDEALARSGQFWPCDAPFAETATVGGTIGADANGPSRLRYGRIRESVLGMRIVCADGSRAKSGSRVVKSVAGYDLHKLIAGSYGTLGLIAEVTLKVAPRPLVERIAVGRFASPVGASTLGRQIAGSNLFPMAVVVMDEASARTVGGLLPHVRTGGWLLLVRCGGNKRAVDRQTGDIAKACALAGAEHVGEVDELASARVWSGVREAFGGAAYDTATHAVVKISCVPTDVATAIDALARRWPKAHVTAQPGVGVAFAHVPVGDDARSHADEELTVTAARAGWHLSTLSAPPGWAEAPASAPGAPLPTGLVRAVKAAFDPAGLFDPGRLPAGV